MFIEKAIEIFTKHGYTVTESTTMAENLYDELASMYHAGVELTREYLMVRVYEAMYDFDSSNTQNIVYH
jgi:hypothetical protein